MGGSRELGADVVEAGGGERGIGVGIGGGVVGESEIGGEWDEAVCGKEGWAGGDGVGAGGAGDPFELQCAGGVAGEGVKGEKAGGVGWVGVGNVFIAGDKAVLIGVGQDIDLKVGEAIGCEPPLGNAVGGHCGVEDGAEQVGAGHIEDGFICEKHYAAIGVALPLVEGEIGGGDCFEEQRFVGLHPGGGYGCGCFVCDGTGTGGLEVEVVVGLPEPGEGHAVCEGEFDIGGGGGAEFGGGVAVAEVLRGEGSGENDGVADIAVDGAAVLHDVDAGSGVAVADGGVYGEGVFIAGKVGLDAAGLVHENADGVGPLEKASFVSPDHPTK